MADFVYWHDGKIFLAEIKYGMVAKLSDAQKAV